MHGQQNIKINKCCFIYLFIYFLNFFLFFFFYFFFFFALRDGLTMLPSSPLPRNCPLNITKCSALWVFKNWFPAENSFNSTSVIITESSLFRILITKGLTWQQWCLLTDKHEDLEQGPAVLLSKHSLDSRDSKNMHVVRTCDCICK